MTGFCCGAPPFFTLAELNRLANQAEAIAGSCGSAMHNELLQPRGVPLNTLNFAHGLPTPQYSAGRRGQRREQQPLPAQQRRRPSHRRLRCTQRPPFYLERCLEGVARLCGEPGDKRQPRRLSRSQLSNLNLQLHQPSKRGPATPKKQKRISPTVHNMRITHSRLTPRQREAVG